MAVRLDHAVSRASDDEMTVVSHVGRTPALVLA